MSTPLPPEERTRWFTEARFGLFIHWGLYANGARHEWLMNHEEIPIEEYERKYFKHFNPDLYNPEAWAQAAAEAGMRYFVITTKHHEGFCLWDTQQTDYKAPNTEAGRDLLRPMVEAFRARGLHVGFYYSVIDWHHPQNFIDNRVGPYRNLSAEEIAEKNKGRDQKIYAKYIRDQVTELLTGYGPIDILWFDYSYPPEDPADFSKGKGRLAWESEKLVETVRSLAPDILLNDRIDLPGSGDIVTPEQYTPAKGMEVDGKPVVWEACQTFSGSWGYHRDEMRWRSSAEIIHTLIDCVSKNGNLLLNVGPNGRGEMDARALKSLKEIGAWMRVNSDSIYGCGAAPEGFEPPSGCAYTYNKAKNRLYLHILSWPHKTVYAKNIADKIEYAQFLHDHSEITFGLEGWQKAEAVKNMATFIIPWEKPAGIEVPVIEIFLK